MKQLRIWPDESARAREEATRWRRLPAKSREEVVVQFVRLIAESVIGANRRAEMQKEKRR